MTKRHIHKTWLLAGGLVEWCYQCGAYRSMRQVPNCNGVTPDSRWQRPAGLGAENPAMKDVRRATAQGEG